MKTLTQTKYVINRPWLLGPDSTTGKELTALAKEDLRSYFPDIDMVAPWCMAGFIENTNTGVEEGCIYFWIGSNQQTVSHIGYDPNIKTELEKEKGIYLEELADVMESLCIKKIRSSERLCLAFSYDFGYLPLP